MAAEDTRQAAADRLVEAAALVLEGAGGTLGITSLNKALFYLDLRALLDLGHPVTGTTFLALPAGPVVAKYQKRVVDALEDRDLAQQSDEEMGDYSSKPVSLIAEPPRLQLGEKEAQLARELGAWAKTKTAKELSDYSHKNVGYRMAWTDGLGGESNRARPINLLIAIQQLADTDEWVTSKTLDEETAQAFADADTATGHEF